MILGIFALITVTGMLCNGHSEIDTLSNIDKEDVPFSTIRERNDGSDYTIFPNYLNKLGDNTDYQWDSAKYSDDNWPTWNSLTIIPSNLVYKLRPEQKDRDNAYSSADSAFFVRVSPIETDSEEYKTESTDFNAQSLLLKVLTAVGNLQGINHRDKSQEIIRHIKQLNSRLQPLTRTRKRFVISLTTPRRFRYGRRRKIKGKRIRQEIKQNSFRIDPTYFLFGIGK